MFWATRTGVCGVHTNLVICQFVPQTSKSHLKMSTKMSHNLPTWLPSCCQFSVLVSAPVSVPISISTCHKRQRIHSAIQSVACLKDEIGTNR